MKKILWIAALAGLMTGVMAQAGEVFYQSNFTGADLTSAGLETVNTAGGVWSLDTVNDRAKFDGTGNARANLYTTTSWQSDDGFTLNVTFNQIADGTWCDFGLVDAGFVLGGNPPLQNTTAYSIGFATSGALAGGGDCLGFNNSSTKSVLSTAQGNITLNTAQTLSFTVTSTNWSYSLNGAAATTGAMTFDTSRNFKFYAFLQGGTPSATGSYFSNIKLTTPGLAPPPDAKSVELIIYQ
jgi:hypothetical protein